MTDLRPAPVYQAALHWLARACALALVLGLGGVSLPARADTYTAVRAYEGHYYVGGTYMEVEYPTFAQAAQAAWNAWTVPSFWPGTQKVDWFTNPLYPPCQTKEEPTYLAYGTADWVEVWSSTRSSEGNIGCTSTFNEVLIYLTCPGGGNLWKDSDGQYMCINAPECSAPQVRDVTTGLCVTLLPEENLGRPTCPVGNPCNPATGNKYHAAPEYAGGAGVPGFTRHYNSQLGNGIGIGVNWTSTLHRRLEFPGGMVLARAGSGRGESFTCPAGGGACTGDADARIALVKDATGYYTLTRPDGVSERYDTVGRLLSETDPAVRTTTYGYDSTTGRVVTVRGPFGHTLTWDGLLATLTPPDGQPIHYSYVSLPTGGANPVRVDYPDGTATLYHYEDAAHPSALTGLSYVEADATTTRYATYGYDAAGKAVLTEHAGGAERVTLTYDSATQTTVRDAADTAQVLTFAPTLGVNNLLAKLNQADGKALAQTFDARNNRTCRQDEEGRVTTYAYNATNQRTAMTEGQTGTCSAPQATAATRTTAYQYLAPTLDLPTVISAPSVAPGLTKTTTLTYSDSAHPYLPTAITQSGYTPAGVAVSRGVSLTYNAAGQLASLDGPRTDVADLTTLTYYECTTGGACGQLQSVRNALGQTTTYDSYDANGRVTQMTDPNGLVTTYTYDGRGRVHTITLTPPGGSARTTTYTYNAAGNITSVTFPDGAHLTYTYNAAQQLTRVTDALGNYIAYDYDPRGNRTGEATYDPAATLVRQVTRAFDLRNRLAQLSAGGSLTQYVFDAVGNLVAETDGEQHTTTHGYDALNRLYQTLDALSGVTGYGYDANGQRTAVSAPNGAATSYSYDDLGNLLSEVSPDRGTTSYMHDAAGNVTAKTDALGQPFTYSYDAANRLTRLTAPVAADTLIYTYDSCANGAGRLCAVRAGDEGVADPVIVTYAYNAFGQVTAHQGVGYEYDAAGRVSTLTYPSGAQVSYSYDAAGQVSGVSLTRTGQTTPLASSITHAPFGPVMGLSYGNGLAFSRTLDTAYRPTAQSVPGALSLTGLQYDSAGNLTARTDGATAESYGYDALNRLTSASGAFGTRGYTYDANGNRTLLTLDAGSVGYTYAPASNRLAEIDATPVTLDPNGNTQALRGGTLLYTTHNRLMRAYDASSDTSYRYNGLGQRVEKTPSGAATTHYVYGLDGALLAETDAAGAVRVEYVYLEGAPLAVLYATGAVPLAYVHTDPLGTPRALTDATGVVVWRATYDPFGQATVNADSDGDGNSVTFNLRLPGQYYDEETGLHYNYFRTYDPGSGRYLTFDPIGLAGGLNPYLYANANPLRYTDPLGLCPFCIAGGSTVGAAGSGTAAAGGAVGSRPGSIDTTAPFWPKWIRDLFANETHNELPGLGGTWDEELEYADNGPKTEHYECKNSDDENCKARLVGLLQLYGLVRMKELEQGPSAVVLDKLRYNDMARAYHRDCPYWRKVPLFSGGYQ